MEQNKGSGWKWVAGGLAVLFSYNVGYQNGVASDRSYASSVATPGTETASAPTLTATQATYTPPALTSPAAPAGQPDQAFQPEPFVQAAAATTSTEPLLQPSTSAPVPTSVPVTAAALVRPVSSGYDYSAEDAEPLDNAGEEAAESAISTAYAAPVAAASSSPSYSSSYLPKAVGVGCAENGSCYGDFSGATGRAKTVAVRGYYRRDGTYVRSHYRSRAR